MHRKQLVRMQVRFTAQLSYVGKVRALGYDDFRGSGWAKG